ncbi:MAG TPA: DUF2071 domain-containing protein [Planctomicrobium sp.]|nr:DUF2071 domain-containing protein [Planctomicrobium sp.]
MRIRPPEHPAMYQSWRDLLFLHWKVSPELAQSWLPPGLTIETFQGHAWVGVVPFKMRNIRPTGLPALPWLSNFLELNVRTYAVDENGTAGVWFLSLDANRWLAVQIARRWFHLPYYWSAMTCGASDRAFEYHCRRQSSASPVSLPFIWTPHGSPRPATPGTLDEFLIERYILFASLGRKRITTGEVWHSPYLLQEVELTSWSDQSLRENGISLLNGPPDHVTASPGVDVEVFPLKR